MRQASVALLIILSILSILSGLLSVGSTATSLPVMTTQNQSNSKTYYHIFDEKDAQIPALLDASMTLSNRTRTELLRAEGEVLI